MSRRDLKNPSADARKLGSFLVELMSITSSPPGSAGYASDHRHLLNKQVTCLLQFVPVWWQIVCSPLAAVRLMSLRRQLFALESFDLNDYRRLRRLVCRLRFGYVLDPYVVSIIDESLNEGWLTQRDAWRLTHSTGCRIQQGTIEPSPTSAWVAGVGGITALALFAACAALIFGAVAAWCDPTQSRCGFIGYAALAYFTAHLAPFVLCLTWGRRKAGVFLTRLLDGDVQGVHQSRSVVTSLSRLAW